MPRVKLEIASRIAKLTLTRPEALNAIDEALLAEFDAALDAVREAPEVVVLVTQGSGRAFSAGSDLKALANCASPAAAAAFESEHARVFALLEALPQITVAAWRGHVLGGGLFMGVYHDFRVSARSANIGLPEVAHGWTPPWGVSRLAELIGQQAAKKLVLCGGSLNGETARQLGLVDEVWPDAAFGAELERWLAELASRPPPALRETKALFTEMRALEHDRWEQRATAAFQRCYATAEAQAAARKFVDRKS